VNDGANLLLIWCNDSSRQLIGPGNSRCYTLLNNQQILAEAHEVTAEASRKQPFTLTPSGNPLLARIPLVAYIERP
jgi:hypothetical protein